MEEKSLSSTRKRVLYIGLFIVPFLAAMALIFLGKGIGTLPILGEDGSWKQLSVKHPDQYYTVPEIAFHDFNGNDFSLNHQDSTIAVVMFLHKERLDEWEKHIMYATKIMKHYSNTDVYTIFESDSLKHDWTEDPREFFKLYPKWKPGFATSKEFEFALSATQCVQDSANGMYKYVIIDKERHIRAYLPINDLKAAKDISKMLKILNNQYAPRKLDIKEHRP